MTDEEMAEEWLDKRYLKDMGVRKPCKEAFLAGLKAGRPEWHKVADGDLPKKDCEVVTLHENGNKNIINWKNGNWTNAIVIPVIAWCEIPKYTEE